MRERGAELDSCERHIRRLGLHPQQRTMVKVKKRDGRWEEYVESKIATAAKASGASAKEAAQVAKEVTAKLAKQIEITAEELSEIVIKAIGKANKAAAKEFVKFRDSKLKAKKKKS